MSADGEAKPWGSIARDVTQVLQVLLEEAEAGHKTHVIAAIKKAKGLVVITSIKMGTVLSTHIGFGLVLKRLPDGRWSGPACIGTGGLGAGAVWGAAQTDTVIALHSESAMNTFSGKGQLMLGTDVAVAAGSAGRGISADAGFGDGGAHAGAVGWTHSKGIFGGVSLESTVINIRNDENAKYYGMPVTVQQVFSGEVPPPTTDPDVVELYQVLDEIAAVRAA